jgi:hypothetical protein
MNRVVRAVPFSMKYFMPLALEDVGFFEGLSRKKLQGLHVTQAV